MKKLIVREVQVIAHSLQSIAGLGREHPATLMNSSTVLKRELAMKRFASGLGERKKPFQHRRLVAKPGSLSFQTNPLPKYNHAHHV
jgi:hypothetical protein